ncbi:hypothetical protein PZA11_002468 [Diplocarpon coronariae]
MKALQPTVQHIYIHTHIHITVQYPPKKVLLSSPKDGKIVHHETRVWWPRTQSRWFQSAGLYGKPEMFEAMEGGQSSQAPLRALDPTGGDSLSNGFDRVVYKTLTMVQRRQEREGAGALFFS